MIKIKSKFILSIVLSLSLLSTGFVANARTFNELLGRSGEDSIYFHSTKLLFNQQYLNGIWEGLGDDGVGLWKYWGVSAGIEWRLLPKLLTEGAFQPLWRKRKDD